MTMTNPIEQHHLLVETVIEQMIGQRLRQARTASGLSIEQLAILSGYSAAELRHYEKAEISIPVQRAIRLSKLLGIDLTAVLVPGGAVCDCNG